MIRQRLVVPTLERLEAVLAGIGPVVVACSGGIDSLLLATAAHRCDPDRTIVAHAIAPAVPAAATARVLAYGEREGWRVRSVETAELADERYATNGTDRCYHCKLHLYEALSTIARRLPTTAVVVSGANVDDLDDFRPGLVAAKEHGVRHPFVEARIGKSEIRQLAGVLGLPDAELPASPCLASRLYTGTRVTMDRLRAVEIGEELVRQLTGIDVVRCRIRGQQAHIEVPAEQRRMITEAVVAATAAAMRLRCSSVTSVVLDDRPYRRGRAVLIAR